MSDAFTAHRPNGDRTISDVTNHGEVAPTLSLFWANNLRAMLMAMCLSDMLTQLGDHKSPTGNFLFLFVFLSCFFFFLCVLLVNRTTASDTVYGRWKTYFRFRNEIARKAESKALNLRRELSCFCFFS